MLSFDFNLLDTTLSAQIWKKILKIDEFKGQWQGGANLNPRVLGRLKKSVLVTSTGASTRIEGSKLSDDDIEKMMRGIDIQKFVDRDKQEVRGYFELLDNVFSSWKSLQFSEGLIKHFHRELLKYVDKDKLHRGEYKRTENKVHMVNKVGESVGILFDITPAYLTPKSMIELIEKTRKALEEDSSHPLLVIASFIVQFLQIHPFADGNGRMSRILTNLLLLQAGYRYIPYVSHEKIIEDNKPDYYLALRSSQKTFSTNSPSIISWLEFFLNVMLEQSKEAIFLLSSESIEKLLSPIQLKVWVYFDEFKQATPKELSEKLDIPRPTINQVLNKLLSFKKIERLGQGRAVSYTVLPPRIELGTSA